MYVSNVPPQLIPVTDGFPLLQKAEHGGCAGDGATGNTEVLLIAVSPPCPPMAFLTAWLVEHEEASLTLQCFTPGVRDPGCGTAARTVLHPLLPKATLECQKAERVFRRGVIKSNCFQPENTGICSFLVMGGAQQG